mmetsp:Transcript_24164/g.38052  ORF Transcript_24164/g.38052 Transcript_24164/m.38052 type:complete len:334 (+) Transcript_24164:1549-2550(+)
MLHYNHILFPILILHVCGPKRAHHVDWELAPFGHLIGGEEAYPLQVSDCLVLSIRVEKFGVGGLEPLYLSISRKLVLVASVVDEHGSFKVALSFRDLEFPIVESEEGDSAQGVTPTVITVSTPDDRLALGHAVVFDVRGRVAVGVPLKGRCFSVDLDHVLPFGWVVNLSARLGDILPLEEEERVVRSSGQHSVRGPGDLVATAERIVVCRGWETAAHAEESKNLPPFLVNLIDHLLGRHVVQPRVNPALVETSEALLLELWRQLHHSVRHVRGREEMLAVFERCCCNLGVARGRHHGNYDVNRRAQLVESLLTVWGANIELLSFNELLVWHLL